MARRPSARPTSPPRRRHAPEALEPRLLLAADAPPGPANLASVTGGVLTLHMGLAAGSRAGFLGNDGDVGEQFAVSRDPADPSKVLVTAFGYAESYAGATSIRADGAGGDDAITVAADVTIPATLTGGDGADVLRYLGSAAVSADGGAGKDSLTGGTGEADLRGGDGDDTLTGGTRPPLAPTGFNRLDGGDGNDTLVGGTGRKNSLVGGSGNDALRGGDGGDAMYGDDVSGDAAPAVAGDDQFDVGAGTTVVLAGPGDDRVTWQAGDGDLALVGGAGDDTLAAAGSATAEAVDIAGRPDGSVQVLFGLRQLGAGGIEALAVGGGGGGDAIVVDDLTGSGVRRVDVALAGSDGATDEARVLGREGADDAIAVEAEGAGTLPAAVGSALTRVSGIAGYVVRVAHANDRLVVDAVGGNDAITVAGVAGPTLVAGGAGDDRITAGVLPSAAAPPPGGRFAARLRVDAGTGDGNAFTFVDATPAGAAVTLAAGDVRSAAVPLGVAYAATGGGLGGGVAVLTGAGRDRVVVRGTPAGTTTAVRTGAGDDVVSVGSADGPTSTLNAVSGSLVIDGEGGTNALALNDAGATAGNQNVVVDAATASGIAGADDEVVVAYGSTGGQTRLELSGSNRPTVTETFTLNNPAAALLLACNGGPETVHARTLSRPATILGGAGDDVVTLGYTGSGLPAGYTVDTITASLVTVAGGAGADAVNVFDQGSSTPETYALTPGTLVFKGVTLALTQVELLDVRGSKADDAFRINGLPAAPLLARFDGGGSASAAGNQVVGPNAPTTFHLTGPLAGDAGGRVRFSRVQTVGGGAAHDTFAIAKNVNPGVRVVGGGGADSLDYRAWAAAVTVDLAAGTASGLASVRAVSDVLGGGAADRIFGDAGPNTLYGGGGNDRLAGRGGRDHLNGGGQAGDVVVA